MKNILTLVLFYAVFASHAQTPVSSDERQIVFQNVSVVSTVDGKINTHQTVLVKGGADRFRRGSGKRKARWRGAGGAW